MLENIFQLNIRTCVRSRMISPYNVANKEYQKGFEIVF